jgi:hypothetical protein
MEEKWSTYLKSWENINRAMIDLQLSNSRPLEDFWGFEEVMSEFQEIEKKHEEDIKRIVSRAWPLAEVFYH